MSAHILHGILCRSECCICLLRRRHLLILHQFVPFQRFRGNPIQLTAEVLAEVPDQVVRYMADNKIAPRQPLPTLDLSASALAAPSAPPLTPTSASSAQRASFSSIPPPPPPPVEVLSALPQGIFLLSDMKALFAALSSRNLTCAQVGPKSWISRRNGHIMYAPCILGLSSFPMCAQVNAATNQTTWTRPVN